jgi:hypothetical protein
MKEIVTGNTPEWNAKMEVYIAKSRSRGDYETWFDMPKFKDINDAIQSKKKLLKK